MGKGNGKRSYMENLKIAKKENFFCHINEKESQKIFLLFLRMGDFPHALSSLSTGTLCKVVGTREKEERQ